jgi:hypothetical protein
MTLGRIPMGSMIHPRSAGHPVKSWSRVVSVAAQISVLAAGTMYLWSAVTLAAEQPVSGRRSATGEVIPAPLPSARHSKDPLADLFSDEEFKDEFRSIGQVGVDIRPRDVRQGKPLGDMPPDLAASVLSRQMQTNGGTCRREWPCLCFHWEASGLYFQPLYFEETNLERYGYSPRGIRLLQPVLSAGNFFLTIPLLPYKIASQPPRQGTYTLGLYRPGSPVPYRINRPEFRLAGVVAEAAVISGIILLIP